MCRTFALIFLFVYPGSVFCGNLCGYDTGACVLTDHVTGKCDGKEAQLEKALKALAPLIGKTFHTESNPSSDYYEVGVCAHPTLGQQVPDDSKLKEAGAVQKTSDGKLHSIGSLNHTELMIGSNFISLEYEMGEVYGSHCQGEEKRTVLMLICKEGEFQGTLQMVDENNNKNKDCYYLFELEHDAACLQFSTATGLSAGSIVCIVALSLVLTYLIGGMIYQRFVVGAKGWEQIPHYSFWQDFGNLQADGCDLVFRSKRGTGSRQYRGFGDDQLPVQEEVIDRDDQILPM